jgi:hypothetical protein
MRYDDATDLQHGLEHMPFMAFGVLTSIPTRDMTVSWLESFCSLDQPELNNVAEM